MTGVGRSAQRNYSKTKTNKDFDAAQTGSRMHFTRAMRFTVEGCSCNDLDEEDHAFQKVKTECSERARSHETTLPPTNIIGSRALLSCVYRRFKNGVDVYFQFFMSRTATNPKRRRNL